MSHSLCLPRAGALRLCIVLEARSRHLSCHRSLPSWGHPRQGPIHLTSAFPHSQNRASIPEGRFTCPFEAGLGGTATSQPARVAHATLSTPPAQMLQDSQAPRRPGGSEPGHLCKENTRGPRGGPCGPSKRILCALTSRPLFQTAPSQRTPDGPGTGLSSLPARPPRPDPSETARGPMAEGDGAIGRGGLRPFPAATAPGPCAGDSGGARGASPVQTTSASCWKSQPLRRLLFSLQFRMVGSVPLHVMYFPTTPTSRRGA